MNKSDHSLHSDSDSDAGPTMVAPVPRMLARPRPRSEMPGCSFILAGSNGRGAELLLRDFPHKHCCPGEFTLITALRPRRKNTGGAVCVLEPVPGERYVKSL